MEMSHQQYIEELDRITDPVARKMFVNTNYPIVGKVDFVMHDPDTAKAVTETGNELVNEIVANLDTDVLDALDLEICRELRDKYKEAKKQYTEFAMRIAEKRSKFKVGDLVIDRLGDHFTYRIDKITGYAVDSFNSNRFFGVAIIGIRVNKKTLKPTGVSRKSLTEDWLTLVTDEPK